MLVELQGRGSGSGEEVCVYVCERVHVRARERGGGGGGQRVQVGCVPTHCLCAGLDNECVISFRLWMGKNAVAAWAGHLGKKNGNSKPCADIGGGCCFFF